jgi:hypothetical protein
MWDSRLSQWCWRRICSYTIWRNVYWYIGTNVLEKLIASIFLVVQNLRRRTADDCSQPNWFLLSNWQHWWTYAIWSCNQVSSILLFQTVAAIYFVLWLECMWLECMWFIGPAFCFSQHEGKLNLFGNFKVMLKNPVWKKEVSGYEMLGLPVGHTSITPSYLLTFKIFETKTRTNIEHK